VSGSFGARARQDTPAIIDLVRRGAIDVASPVTRRYSLTDAGVAYADLLKGKITGRAIIDMNL
jgi:succinate semialdehyde reductase (NADPH)